MEACNSSQQSYLGVAANGNGRYGTLSSQTSETLSSRTSVSSSFYSSSGFSDGEDWELEEAESGGSGSPGSNGEDLISSESYRRRLSEESRRRLVRKLDSIRCNPNHYVRRIVPVSDGSSGDGAVPTDPREVYRRREREM